MLIHKTIIENVLPQYMFSFTQAVLVDMEEGVVSELMNGPLAEVFDNQQLLTDVSGSGNNWYIADLTCFYCTFSSILCNFHNLSILPFLLAAFPIYYFSILFLPLLLLCLL